MLEMVLPEYVGRAEVRGPFGEPDLYPDEAAAVDDAGETRRRQFGAGRNCARQAMAQLGRQPTSIPRDADGTPQWPEGLVGSITHCRQYAAAAVASAAGVSSIGIDAEPNESTLPSVLHRIALAEELVEIRRYASHTPEVNWDRLLFSAKETVYKAWFPLTRRWLRFTDVVVSFAPTEGTFSARVLLPDVVPSNLRELSGRWHCADVILTCVVITRHDDEALQAVSTSTLSLLTPRYSADAGSSQWPRKHRRKHPTKLNYRP